MNKIVGILLPYLIIIFISIMQFVTIPQKLVFEALVIGITIGLWFLCLQKSEGTVMMKLGMILSLVIFAVATILAISNFHLDLLTDFTPILALISGCECIGLYIVSQNKTTLSMSYKYSYKNKRRRYF